MSSRSGFLKVKVENDTLETDVSVCYLLENELMKATFENVMDACYLVERGTLSPAAY